MITQAIDLRMQLTYELSDSARQNAEQTHGKHFNSVCKHGFFLCNYKNFNPIFQYTDFCRLEMTDTLRSDLLSPVVVVVAFFWREWLNVR